MAPSRGKTAAKRKGGKRPRKGSSRSPLWPWLVMLIVVGGGIVVYDNSTAARRFVASLKGEKPVRTAASVEKPVPSNPVPPKPVAVTARPMPAAKHPPRPVDSTRTAAIIPPAPIGKPVIEAVARPSEGKANEKLAGAYQAKFFLCGSAKQDDCVVSADRFVFHGQKIRLVGIEVPNIKKPACEDERIKASDAELRVRAFLDSGPFELVSWQGNDAEIDGHKLREVRRNGMSLADILVREGLARRPGGKGGWC